MLILQLIKSTALLRLKAGELEAISFGTRGGDVSLRKEKKGYRLAARIHAITQLAAILLISYLPVVTNIIYILYTYRRRRCTISSILKGGTLTQKHKTKMEPFLPPDPTQRPQAPNNTQTKDEAARALVYMSSTPNQEQQPTTIIANNNVCPPVLPPPSLPAPQNSRTRKSTDVKANKTTLPIKKQARRLCSVEGCTKQAKKGGICIKHGAKVRKCSHEGCTNNALKSGLCIRHGAKITRRTCKFQGCTNKVQCAGVCFRHGARNFQKKPPKSAQIVHIGNASASTAVVQHQNPKNIVNGNQISQNSNVWIDGAGNVVNNNNGTVIPASQRNVIASSDNAGSRKPSQNNVQDMKLPGDSSSYPK